MGIFAHGPGTPGPWAPAKPAAYTAHRPLTASAQRITFKDQSEADAIRKRRAADSWQTDAWAYFDSIGEVKYSANLIGSILSRVRLYAAVVENPDEPPVPVKDASTRPENPVDGLFAAHAQRALARLDSANGGLSGLVQRAGVNIWVAGECNLVQVPEKIGHGIPEKWDIKSISELVLPTGGKGGAKIRDSRNGPTEDLPEHAFIGRIWRSHPEYSGEADSSLKAVRDPCDELLLYGRMARVIGRSRMNAGALLLPDGMSISEKNDDIVDPDADGDSVITTDTEDDTAEFEQELLATISTPVQDEDSAASITPLIMRGPAELLKEVRTITFERTLDPELLARGDRALERVLQGLDIPKDVITGLANVKYSNAVQIDESMYKAHIEPLILLICDALTAVYFRPSLIASGHTELAKHAVIWFDPTEILTRPDRHQTANDGHDRMVISDDAWRRMNGFNEADAPTAREKIVRMVQERGPVNEVMVDAILKILDPELFAKTREQSQEGNAAPLSDHARSILEGGAPAAPAAPTEAPTGDAPDLPPVDAPVEPLPPPPNAG